VHHKTESLNADHLVLAIGYHDNRFIPQWQVAHQPDAPRLEPDFAWIQTLKQSGASVHHIYEPGFNVDTITPCESIIVVGGGFSGVQLALKLVEKNLAKHVTLLVEQPIQVHEFDADTGWANPNSLQMQQFLEANHAQRRATIQQERHPGSINTPLSHRLRDAIAAQKIQLVVGKTTTADYNNQQITLHLTPLIDHEPSTLQANQVLLATGYRLTKKPGGPWLTALEKALGLPTHDDYPILDDSTLQWGDRQLYVAGQMAELSLGPLARNIAGVKLSTDKIVNSPAAQRSSTRYKVVTFQGQRSKRLHRVA
jgi:lysine/ornithine N-monooxygenase